MPVPTLRPGLGLALLATLAAAQEPTALVRTGDTLPGIGAVTAIARVHVDDLGQWVVLVTTDNPAVAQVVLRPGGVWSRVGDPVPGLSGVTVAGYDAFTEDGWGGLIWNGRLRGTPAGPRDDEGVFYEHGTGFRTGEPTASLGYGFPAGTIWTSFDDVLFPHGETTGLLRGTLADPASPGSERSFVALAAQYGSIGICCVVTAIALEGQTAPGLTEAIEEVRTSAWSAAISPDAKESLWSCDLGGPAAADGCVFHQLPGGQAVLVAREGSPAPVGGRTWGPLESPSLDAGRHGHWTLRAELDPGDPATDGIVLLNGAAFVREGDTRPQIAPFVFDDLGGGRAQLTNDGLVLWYAHWSDPVGPAEALFLQDEILVRAGTTTVAGVPLVDLASDAHAFDLAPKGQFVLFRGTLAGGREGAFLIDRGGMRTYCVSKHSSAGCYPRLDWQGTSPPSASQGSGFLLRATSLLSQVPGLLFYGTRERLQAPFLGGTLCVAPPLRRLPAAGTGGNPPPAGTCTGSLEVDFNAWIASGRDPSLVAGQDVYVQAWFRDPGFAPPADVGLTHGLELFVLP